LSFNFVNAIVNLILIFKEGKMKFTDVEEIAEALEDNYPDEDVMHIRFTRLQKLVIGLLDFDDDMGLSNERILEAIQGEWIDLRGEDIEED
jgi:FeS assembly protein IscX